MQENKIRLQKAISKSGYCSRRKAEELILKGKVKVNGEVINQLGFTVKYCDVISVNSFNINYYNVTYKYFILNKPKGYISTYSDDLGRKNVLDLISKDDQCGIKLSPVGRLDKDTTGLIILTNDGDFIYKMTHPKFHVSKTYGVKVSSLISKQDIYKLKKGVIIDGKIKVIADECEIIFQSKKKGYCILKLTIHRGIKHQVKKMFNAIGAKVIKLSRCKYGFLEIGNLKIGEYRNLRSFEVRKLLKLVREN